MPWEKAESRIHRLGEVITLKAVTAGLPWSKHGLFSAYKYLTILVFLGIKLSLILIIFPL